MKILHIINNLSSGGAEKLIEDLIPRINQEESFEVDVLLLTDKGNVFYDSLIRKGVKVDVIKYKNIYNPMNILEIKKYTIKGDYDIIHSHLFPTQYWVALLRLVIRNKKKKFITTEHSTQNRRRGKFYFRNLEKFIYSQYDIVISITHQTQEKLINWINPQKKNIRKYVVIENGIDIAKIKAALPYKKNDLIEDSNEDTKLVCMVGRFSEAKDQPTLIKAISKLPNNIHLLLVGEGPLIANNKELAKELGVMDRVHFLGFRHDVNRILKSVDVVVLSSNWEGFGLAAVEGMAAEKPIIISDVEGLNGLVNDDDLKFRVGDYKSLAQKLYKLTTDKEYYFKKAKITKNQCDRFDINRLLMEYLNLYKQFR